MAAIFKSSLQNLSPVPTSVKVEPLAKPKTSLKLEDRSQKKKIMFLHSKNKASRKGYKGEC